MRPRFLEYTTVFRSRLTSCNLLLERTDYSQRSANEMRRHLRQRLDETEEVDGRTESARGLAEYLLEKRLQNHPPYEQVVVSLQTPYLRAGTGRVQVRSVDLQMSDTTNPSTSGVPTANNADEVLDLAVQLNVVNASRGSLNGAGSVAKAAKSLLGTPPLIRDLAVAALFRQAVAVDNLLLIQLISALAGFSPSTFHRDSISGDLFLTVCRSVTDEALRLSRDYRRTQDIRRFRKAVEGAAGGTGPGVREHRLTPRLEWLVDIGLLRKERRNSFTYHKTDSLAAVAASLPEISHVDKANEDDLTLSILGKVGWDRPMASASETEALLQSYELIKRPFGPVAISDVVFLGGLLRGDPDTALLRAHLLSMAKSDGRISLSMGRYRRVPENMYIKRR